MEAEIDSLLKKLLAVNDAMSRITSEGATTTSVTQKLARHRDILHEFNQVYFWLVRAKFLQELQYFLRL
jgi:Golgi SNAP receptor complex protein 1